MTGGLPYEGCVCDGYEVDLEVDCPDCTNGKVAFRGTAYAIRGQGTCQIIGVQCDTCGRRYWIEFDVEPCGCGGEVEH